MDRIVSNDKLNEEEREEMKIKIKNIINNEQNFNNNEKTEDIIKRIREEQKEE